MMAWQGVYKRFGRTVALAGLDLSVQQGEIFGFIGPNGAGKSTAIRIAMDLLRPDAGSVRVLGVDPAAGPSPRARVGYLPGELMLPGERTAGEHLHHLANLRGGRGHAEIPALAERFNLDLSRPMRALSKGNKQKVGLVQAFMHTPDLLVLDEPTSGLDPLLQQAFLELLRERREAGATALMSSHVLREVESVADRVGIIREGRTIDTDSVRELRQRAGQRISLQFAHAPALEPFARIPGVQDARLEGDTLHASLYGSPDAFIQEAARHALLHFSARDCDLEEMFLDVYRLKGSNGGGA